MRKKDTPTRRKGSSKTKPARLVKPSQPAIEAEMYKDHFGGHRPAHLSSVVQEADAIEAFLWSAETTPEEKDNLATALLDLATLTGVNVAHHRIAKAAYKEMVHAFSYNSLEQRLATGRDDERHTAIVAQLIVVCDIIDPEHEWSYVAHCERFFGKPIQLDAPADEEWPEVIELEEEGAQQ
jgi:hypothetical protein